MSADLAQWLLEQIAADEEVARACVGINELAAHINGAPTPRWVYDSMQVHSDDERRIVRVGKTWAAEGAHIARWDPARVLAECAAKRRIVEQYQQTMAAQEANTDEHTRASSRIDRHQELPLLRRDGWVHEGRAWGLRVAVTFLAQPYADRPGWQSEWEL